MPKLAGLGPGTQRPDRAGREGEIGRAGGSFVPGALTRAAGAILIPALLLPLLTPPSLAQDSSETQAGTPAVYVNTDLLERLAEEGPAARSTVEERPQSSLQTPPDWQLESRLYVVPLGQAEPAEPALAPPAPSVLTSELKALQGARATPVRKQAPVVQPRDVPPRPAKAVIATDPEGEAAPRTTGSPTQAPQTAAPAPLPPQSPSEVEIPAAAPPQVTAELRSRGEEAASGASGLENLAPEPQDAAPATLPPQAPGEIEIPAITPPPPAAASPDPESEVPGAATGSDAPPPAAQILGELAEAAEREAPRTRKVIAPPVPEPPPPLAPDADKSDETATADELAPTPSAPEPEERLGPAPSPSTAGDPKQQLAARPPAKAPLEGRILFEAGSTELSPEARGVLEGLAESLKAADAEGVELRAYATGRDSRRLSLSRGLVARGYLEKLGVEADKVFLRPLGDKATDGPSERIDFELVTP